MGEQGAEQIIRKGDMLFMSSANKIFRIHGPYMSESEIEKITSFLRAQGDPDYIEEITLEKRNEASDTNINDSDDDLYQTAIQIVKNEKKASLFLAQSILASLIISIFVTFIGLYGTEPILIFLKTSPSIVLYAKDYMDIIFYGSSLFFFATHC